jgi:tetratricopeptide (TPR) repeat protein
LAHRSRAAREKDKPRNPPPGVQAAVPAPVSAAPIAWKRHLVPLLVLWAMAVLAYSNSFRAGLIYDNQFVIQQDSRIRQATGENIHLILSKDYWYKTSVSSLYRPLATLSYLFNYAVLKNGAAPAGYHAINLALHLANITLVYLLGWLVLAEFWPAFLMAALWGVHPALTESVTNVVGRADLLAAFGVLAGLLCFARSVRMDARRAIPWQIAIVAASAIGIFSKESGIVILAAIFLYDVAWCRAAPVRARVVGYAAAAAPVAVFLAVRAQILQNTPVAPIPFTDNPLVGAAFLAGRLTAVKVLGKCLWLLLWPAHLSCDYSYNQIPLFTGNLTSWQNWQALIALAFFSGAAVLAVYSYRTRRPLFFFIGFFFAALAPTANIFFPIGTIMAERVLYLPSIAVAALIAWGGWQLFQRLQPHWPAARVAATALIAMVCLALGVRTFLRNFDWYDENSLWSSAERACPESYRPHQHVADWLANAKDFDAADREVERSLAILEPLPEKDQVALVYTTAGFCFRARGDSLGPQAGEVWYRKALQVLLEGEKVDAAVNADFQLQNRLAGKEAGPSHAVPFYLELARTYRSLGQYQDALNTLTSAPWPDPQAELFEELSKTYRAMGDAPQAAVALLEGIAMNVPDEVRLAAEVVDLYKQTATTSCALSGSGAASAINFSCPLVREQLCLASRNVAILYHRMHRDNDALSTAAGAVNSLGCPAGMFR